MEDQITDKMESRSRSRSHSISQSLSLGQSQNGQSPSRSGSVLGKLLPKSISKRRKRRHSQHEADDENDANRGRSISVLHSDDSTSSLDPSDDDRSFGSYESNLDLTAASGLVARDRASTAPTEPNIAHKDPPLARPPVSTHPSLIGYLTTSSPEVQATLLDFQSQHSSQALFQAYHSNLAASSRSTSPDPTSDVAHSSAQHRVSEPHTPAKLGHSDRRGAPLPKIETKPPRTPPTSEDSGPVIVNTPPTPVDASSPGFVSTPERKASGNASTPASSADGNPVSQSISVHRRTKSGSAAIVPSKLSNILLPPLTPTPEQSEPPLSAASASGFFSSMIFAAQSAANNLSTNIQNTSLSGLGGSKTRSSPSKSDISLTTSSHVEVESAPEAQMDTMDQKESAVRTLGAGDLSLSHLGFADQPGSDESQGSIKFPDLGDMRARSESAPADTVIGDGDFIAEEASSRPRSLVEGNSGEHTPHTPPQLDFTETKAGVQRTSSVRSAIKPHRKRGSSVTTGGTGATIGAAIAAANNSVANPAAGAPKLTGFAIASKKRNRDFHALFKSVPDDDYLIEDYSCALQREILAHGRLYVSEGHLCFSSNILGWMTTLVMSFDEIVSVEKRSTALLFKNGLMISTLHAKHIFASFTSRDATYDLIVNIWKLGHPTLKSTLNGVSLEGTGGDKTEKIDTEPSGAEDDTQGESDSDEESLEDEDDFYDEDEQDALPDTQLTEVATVVGDAEKPVTRKVSGMTAANGVTEDVAKDSSHTSPAEDFPGPATHPPTDCGDLSSHYEKFLGDDIIPAPLGKVYNLVFGPASVTWMAKWMTTDQKCLDMQMEDKKGLTLENRQRCFTYIKPLNASLGPKQTKCVVTETLENLDFDKAINFSVSTQNPDVPSGNLFSVKTRYCLSWAENNSTRLQSNCTIEWTGKSWLKGPIEKAANEGQGQYVRELAASLKAAVSTRPRAGTATNGGAKPKGKKRKSKALQAVDETFDGGAPPKKAARQTWGLFEPVRPLLEPFMDIIRPILTGNVMYGLLVGLLVATWFGFGFTPKRTAAPFGPSTSLYSSYKLAAYEEMWQREDSELWDWLEERVGLGRLNMDTQTRPKRAVAARTVEEKIRQERRGEREMEEAIRVTEEKLKVLRDVIAKSGAGHAESAAEQTRTQGPEAHI